MIILKVVSAENQGTFSDYHVTSGNDTIIIGDDWTGHISIGPYGAAAGLFFNQIYVVDAHPGIGSRLSKN